MPNATRLEWIGKYTAILSALVATAVGIGQYRRGVSQSMRELEWKQADMARTMTNAMMNDEGWQAMTMLDWEEGRDYQITPGTSSAYPPTGRSVAIEAALANERAKAHGDPALHHRQIRPLSVPGESVAGRGTLRAGTKDDVRFPLNWYVEKRLCPHKKLLLAYIAENSADESRQFFESLDAWQRCAG